jgi:2-iminoacetate synthase
MLIDIEKIASLIEENAKPTKGEVLEIIEKAMELKGLDLHEAALLLSAEGRELHNLVKAGAAKVKERVFGSRIVLFAPLYLTNYCTNGCVYCGFRSANTDVARRALTPEEAVKEAKILEAKGFKRVLLVLGEDPSKGVDYITETVRAIYDGTGIRIVHVNAAPMSVDEFRELKRAGVGLYQSFQETYHPETYAKVHPTGKKKDYFSRLEVMDRALKAGFNDVGIGALLGLYDFRFDTLATIAHSNHLYEKFKAHAHTVSVPRLRPAEGSTIEDREGSVSDADMERVVSVYRLALPTAGVVVTTRESEELRGSLIEAGASQLSASSSTAPGGYGEGENDTGKNILEQFSTNDQRTLEEVMASIAKAGGMPSLCTTCYRVGRVGEQFTETTTSGEMEKFCEANAILTLKEFVLDKRANGNEALFEASIKDALGKVADGELKIKLVEKLAELEAGKRDRFF